jgi:Zn-dependent protease
VTLSGWIILLLAALPSIIFHEVAHGYVAYHFGDPTAKNAGRLTLNPLKHIDPFGTVILPVLLALAGLPVVGYAKPVPVDVRRLRHPRNESVYVALAGPLTNVALVVVATILCKVLLATNVGANSDLLLFGLDLGIVNMFLAVLNMLPIPPLDGSAVVERLVPRRHLGGYFRLRARALPFAMIALLILIYTGAGNRVMADLQNWWFGLLS